MENNYPSYSASASAYPDSNTSTPRSREVDSENATYDEQHNPNPNLNYKVKLMCSYGGKILPRPHDNQLTYIGGDTKILTVDRNIRYASIFHKLHSLTATSDICFKYQLPGEDLDALISVTNDEDLDHMMTEYDRIFRSSAKPVRLRLFMFPLTPSTLGAAGCGGGGDSKTEQQWFVDALNAVQISSSASPMSENPDYMFGFDKGNAPPTKAQDVVVAQTEGDRVGSECGSEDSNSNNNSNSNRQFISDPVVSPTVDIQRQMQESQTQRMQQIGAAGSHEQTISIDPRAYYGDYYTQKIQTSRYLQEQRHMTTGGYQMSVAGTDPPVYLVPSSAGGVGVYPAATHPPPVPAAVSPAVRSANPGVSQGQAYYGMQRMVNPAAELYREQPVYCTMTQTQAQIQQPKVGAYNQEGIGIVRPQPQGEIGGYGQVYYANPQGGGMYQPVGGLALNQEGKMVVNPNKVV